MAELTPKGAMSLIGKCLKNHDNYVSTREDPLTFFFNKKNKRKNVKFLSGPNKPLRTYFIH